MSICQVVPLFQYNCTISAVIVMMGVGTCVEMLTEQCVAVESALLLVSASNEQ